MRCCFCRIFLLLYRKSTEQNIQVSILARGVYLSALSNSDVLRCLVGLHMAGPPWVPRDLKTHALNTHRGRFEIERAIKSLKGIFGNSNVPILWEQ